MTATRSRIYAASAFKHVNEMAGNKEGGKKYGTMVLHLPVLVRTAGLAQALAFVEARGSEDQRKILGHLESTIGNRKGPWLVAESRTADLARYRDLTRRTLEALDWYKRYVQAVLKVEPSDDVGENPS